MIYILTPSYHRGKYSFYMNEKLSPDQPEERFWRFSDITVERGDTWSMGVESDYRSVENRRKMYKSNVSGIKPTQ